MPITNHMDRSRPGTASEAVPEATGRSGRNVIGEAIPNAGIARSDSPCSSPRACSHRRALAAAAIVVALGAAAPAGIAYAQGERLYFGITGLATQLGVTLNKSVDTRAPDTLVPEPRRGQLLEDHAASDSTLYGGGLLAGYRLPILGNALSVSVEFDLANDSGSVEGQLQGVGMSAGRNQLGESWPDRWEYHGDGNYGVSVRLSFVPNLLSDWDTNVYVLAGMRRIEGEFSTSFDGCLSPTPCSSAADTPNFVSGTDSRSLGLQGWTAAVGIERRLWLSFAVRIELRRTQYDNESWVTPFDDVGVTVPTAVGTEQTGIVVGFARYF
ncbi:outer membrane beta-barrel protein [Candidatus Rariloculus sp.]|uniref:outer membrane beta-barrel protein n=1 Tax=Candidatus Rariloculus sp. TaxID=3101265 RepID=UPI003D0E3273